jgi:MDMPI C-terminal domain
VIGTAYVLCWTWWGDTQSPQTSGAAVRHQAQEAAVHTYDAQITAGAPEQLPDEAAVDGVEEFLTTCGTTTVAWPYEPAVVDVHVAEGPSWRVTLSAVGASVSRLPNSGTISATGGGVSPDVAAASVRGAASDVVLALYDRIPLNSLELGGDVRVLDLLRAWDLEP